MKGDINDTLRNGGEDAVRARHDGAKRYSPKSPLVIACAADIKPERVKWLLAGSTSHRQVCCGCRLWRCWQGLGAGLDLRDSEPRRRVAMRRRTATTTRLGDHLECRR